MSNFKDPLAKGSSTTVDVGLPEEFRQRIQSRRKELGLSLKALGEKVGLSDAQLNHIEMGIRLPNASRLIQILAALGFGEKEFLQALQVTEATWAGQLLHGKIGNREEMKKFLGNARMDAGLSVEDIAIKVGASPTTIKSFEQGAAMPSPRFLHLFLGAICLTPFGFLALPAVLALSANTGRKLRSLANRSFFANDFVANIFRREGFRVGQGPSEDRGDNIEVELGGGWKLTVSAQLRFEQEKENIEHGKEKESSTPKAGKGN